MNRRAVDAVAQEVAQEKAEALGLADPSFVFEHYGVPADVVARLGIRVVT